MRCPSCKSHNVKHIKKEKWNGIIGPGSHSYVADEYYSCKKCGVRFDLK